MSNLQAISIIQQFEGCRLTAYPDPGTGAAPWTIGYGSTRIDGKPVTKGMVITDIQAVAQLTQDVASVSSLVLSIVKVELSDNQLAALISFSYNLGIGNLASSTLLKKLNKGDYVGAANEFPKWNRAAGKVMPGLTNRRIAERSLFLTK
jgi:lysozyme